ncbi:MAG: hypothetical protein VX460_02335 [Planctomycetota bacterium]|nr:hypothetical protein [Planctomycetota bacterium]
MRLSGFTFLRNGAKLHYPIIESIRSALPLVDEFVIALGDSDPDDDTAERIAAIGSDKVVTFDTVWDLERYPRGTEHAHQTDLAKERCSGDWLIYLQGDEVLHEDDLEIVRASCERWLDDERVEGMLFDYLHFWGDYAHAHDSHSWYKQEVRIVRNRPEIHSFRSAQSFRRIPDFDGVSYREKEGTEKITVVHSGARIFHYGWVRPPAAMQKKRAYFTRNHHGVAAEQAIAAEADRFDYGPLCRVPRYEGTHPAVMAERIEALDWRADLRERPAAGEERGPHDHESFRDRAITFVERAFFGGRHMWASRNYTMRPGVKLPRKRNAPTPR